MPSKEQMCILSPTSPATTASAQEFFARDMEELVSEIKENLRLSGFKSRSSFAVHHKSRASPYRIPSRSWGDSTCEACLCGKPSSMCNGNMLCVSGGHTCLTVQKSGKSKSVSSDDPYEMLQELLRDGGLIKEAVRRLQRGLSAKQRYFYDSDEDGTRSPLTMCHLEL